LVSGDVTTITAPDFPVLYLLPASTLMPSVMANDPQASYFRQAKRVHWVFLPEVSLGPAFYSLAPPFIG